MKMFNGKRSQMIFVGLMTAVMVFIVLIQFIPSLTGQVNMARDNEHLNCTSTAISTGTRMSCVIVDVYLPYFLAAGIAVSIGFLTQKKYVTISQ